MFATRVPSSYTLTPGASADIAWARTFNRITDHNLIVKMTDSEIEFATDLRDRGYSAEYVSRRIVSRSTVR